MNFKFRKILLTFISYFIVIMCSYCIPLETHHIPVRNKKELDSKILNSTNENEKLAALKDIAIYLTLNQPNQKALEYIDSTNALARKLKNRKALIKTNLLYAKVYIEENKIHAAYEEINKALRLSKKYSYNKLVGESLLMMAYFYKRLGFSAYSLEYCLKANQYISKDDVSNKFYLYIEMGNVYSILNEYKQAINTFYKAFALAQTNDLQILTALSIAKIASVYVGLGQYEKARIYLHKALDIASLLENSDFTKILIIDELGKTYTKEEKYYEALIKYKEVLTNSRRHNFIFYISKSLLNIARINIKLGHYNEAAIYLSKCSAICEKTPMLYSIQLELYSTYSQYYKGINNYEKALTYNEKCEFIKDQLFIDKVANRIAILETKFKHEQNLKSNELLKKSIALKEEKIKSDQRFILFLITISLLILLLTTLFIILYYNKRKYIKKLNTMNRDLETTIQKRTGSLKRTVYNLKKEIKERRKLQKLVEKISDREQRRIGHDIHDSLGQILVGISFTSQALVRKLKKRDLQDLSEEATRIVESASLASTQARDLAKLLAPVALREEGLDNALHRLCTFIKTNYGIDCRLTIFKNEKSQLNIHLATNIYRIIQEATNNAVKHSGAMKIEILLDLTKISAILRVKDHGKGLSVNDRDKFTGMGLKIMETRSELINGKLIFATNPGKGTSITCEFPLNYKPLI
jgi:signal transduction histidine kinase